MKILTAFLFPFLSSAPETVAAPVESFESLLTKTALSQKRGAQHSLEHHVTTSGLSSSVGFSMLPKAAQSNSASDTEAASGVQQRAYGFSELGLLGIHGVTSTGPEMETQDGRDVKSLKYELDLASFPAIPSGELPEESVVSSFSSPLNAPALSSPPNAYASEAFSLAGVEPIGVSVGQRSPGSIGVQRWAAKAQNSVSSTSRPDESDLHELVKPEQNYRTLSESSLPASVLVSEAGGSLRVVVAAPVLSLEAQSKLLKMASEVSDQFGLTLSDFQLNGATLKPSSLGMIGYTNDRIGS